MPSKPLEAPTEGRSLRRNAGIPQSLQNPRAARGRSERGARSTRPLSVVRFRSVLKSRSGL